MHNVVVSIGLTAAIMTSMFAQGVAVARGWVDAASSRKAAHIGLGLLLVVSWTFYEDDEWVRWLASLPLFVIGIYFALLGFGIGFEDRTVTAVSRSGDRKEMFYGPIMFCIPFIGITLLLWKQPAGVAALAFLVLGDGFAEVVGTRMRSPALAWNPDKTLAGTAAALIIGSLGGMAVLALFVGLGHFEAPVARMWPPMFVVAAVGAVVESASNGRYDNFTAAVACAVTGYFVF